MRRTSAICSAFAVARKHDGRRERRQQARPLDELLEVRTRGHVRSVSSAPRDVNEHPDRRPCAACTRQARQRSIAAAQHGTLPRRSDPPIGASLDRLQRLAQDLDDRVDVRLLGDQRRRHDHAIAGRLQVQPVVEQLLLELVAARARRALGCDVDARRSCRSRAGPRRPECPSARRSRPGSTATARGRARTGRRSCRCRAWRCPPRTRPDGRSTCSRGRTRSRRPPPRP